MKIPTAKTFIKNSELGNRGTFETWEVERMLINFANLHRKSIISNVIKSTVFDVKSINYSECKIEQYNDLTTTDEDDYPDLRITINKESIINSYQEDKIK